MRNEFNRKASPAPRRGVAAAGTPFGRKVLLAVACALVACLGAGVALAANEQGGGLSLPANDKQLEAAFEVSVSPDDDVAVHASGKKTTLHAEAKALENGQQADDLDAGYQWQILVDEEAGLWADVQGQDAAGIDLTLGMVSSALNAKGEAQVRCVATAAADEAAESVASDPVKVTVKEAEADAEAADGGDGAGESAAPAVLSETEVEEHAAAAAVRNGGAAAYAAGNGIALLADDAPDVKKTCNVVINYVFEDNGIVSDPYTASLAEGSSFSATVTFPTVQGYLPYVGETPQNSMELNYTSISEDVTINVVYKPTNVDYTVIHYRQNVDNDNYTIESRETRQGLTASQVPEVAKTFEGFYSLLYERPAIAADGSTVIEVYYDRYYYLMNFDMDGGYGTEPVYARYGASIGTVADPTKAGYTFQGWSETEGGTTAVTLPTTMPAESKTYHAIWEPDATAKVTVVFWGENADDEEYSYLADATKVINLKPGKEFTYSEDKMLVCDIEEHSHTDCTLNCGKEEHTHADNCRTLTCAIENHTHSDDCYSEHHTHSTDCYAGVGDASAFGSTGKPHNPSEGQVYEGRFSTYIYIKGTWYYYTGSTASGSVAPATCGQEEGMGNLICGKEETHYHSKDCYSNVGDEPWRAPDGTPSNPVDGQIYTTTESYWGGSYTTSRYIYINGAWYNYNASADSDDIIEPICGQKGPHVHTDACYTPCNKEEHTHTDACYSCGKEEHSHGTDCYMQGAGLDSKLWKFEKSDTVTVAADGSTVVNVYYERTTFTLHFQKAHSNSDDYGTITEKWGSNIRSKFEAKNTQAGTALWSTSKDGSSPWTSFLDKMPEENRTYYANSASGSTHTAVYYGEPLNGTQLETLYTSKVVYNGNLTVTEEDKVEIEGFTYVDTLSFNNRTYNSTANKSSFNDATFYYTRNTFKIEYNNYSGSPETKAAKFGASIDNDTFNWTPTDAQAPTMYEPGSVTFGGWYLNPQCTGEPYAFTNKTMPAGPNNDDGEVALVLYAKWVPVTHTVTFYLDKTAYDQGDKLSGADGANPRTVLHGEKLTDVPSTTKGGYEFIGWFYMEGDVEKAFDFANMEVRKDLEVYGKWSSNTLKQYTVQYVLAEKQKDGTIAVKTDDDGKPIKVADDLTGSGLAGTTRTFDAKGGAELYAAYQEGYFPTVQSQSLLLDIESDSLVITFEYVPMSAVPYTVKYVEKDTGKSLADDKVVSDNRKAVVTETFEPISGYMPDAYQKRLVVTADGENILCFYYSKDETHAYYKITHYTQNTDGETWTEYASSQAVGDIGTRYTSSPMAIPGFTYEKTEYMVNGTEVTDVTAEGAKLTEGGLEINLYYVCNEYPYQVRYLEQGSGNVLHDPKNGTGRYGQVISESAIDIEGYDKVDPTSVTLSIRIEESQTEAKLNIITFYYKEQEVTINYEAVGPEGATDFGSVSPKSETVKVKSGTAQGSTPTAGDGFKFVGWYKDEACTQPVDASWVTDGKIVPQKTDGKNVAATYYAKFEHDVTSLTITKVADKDTTFADGDTFVFTVTGPDGFSTQVVIHGAGSVTISGLKVGSYTVTEDGNWSWRYSAFSSGLDDNGEIKLDADGAKNKVTFTNAKAKERWLDFGGWCRNLFGANGVTSTSSGEAGSDD